MQNTRIYEVVSQAGTARGLAIAGIIVDLIAIDLSSIVDPLFIYVGIVGQFLFLLSWAFYHDYDCRDTIFDGILYVLLFIILLPTFIFLIIVVIHFRLHGEEKKVKITNIGDGYVEKNEYGNYTLIVGNEYSGYSKIPLTDYNSATGKAIDNEGTEYKIG